MRKPILLILSFIILFFNYSTSQNLYVDAGSTCTSSCTGSTWSDALNTLQDALTLVGPLDTIFVAEGVYYPDEGIGYTDNDDIAKFILPDSVVVLGGYPTGGGVRNWFIHETILSGEIQQDNDSTNNSVHIVQTEYVSLQTVLDGFTVTRSRGSAFYNIGIGTGNPSVDISSPTIKNCTFTSNYAYKGAAIYNRGLGGVCLPLIVNCKFFRNRAGLSGGAIFNQGRSGNASPQIINCSFSGNNADEWGGAIYNEGSFNGFSSPEIINCSFSNNHAIYGGGAIKNDGTSNGFSQPWISNCIIWGNSSDEIYNASSDPIISHSVVGNSAVSVDCPGSVMMNPDMIFDFDPLFIDTASNNLALTVCSKAIDIGINDSIPSYLTNDVTGNPRLYNNNRVDLGAYEYQQNPDFIRVDSVITLAEPTCSYPLGSCEVFLTSSGDPYEILWDNMEETAIADTLDEGLHTVWVTNLISSCIDSFQICVNFDFPGMIYVDSSATGTNSGCNWFNAYTKLQDAMIRARSGDIIYVAKGTYYPDELTNSNSDDRYESFQIPDGGQLIGGYPSGGGIRDVALNKTILSGEIQQDSVIANNSRHIVYIFNSVQDTYLDGFTITGSQGSSYIQNSGAVLNFSYGENEISNVRIINCIFIDNYGKGGASITNYATDYSYAVMQIDSCVFLNNFADEGSSIYSNTADSGTSTLIADNCSFDSNYSQFGSAIYLNSHSYASVGYIQAQILNSVFNENTSQTEGGAIYAYETDISIVNCGFIGNSAAKGGAIYNRGGVTGHTSVISQCRFLDNSSTGYGGAIYNHGYFNTEAKLSIEGCSFESNSASLDGGAIYTYGVNFMEYTPIITNCKFWDNYCEHHGGAIFNNGYDGESSLMLINCSVANNTTLYGSGALCNSDADAGFSSPVIVNSVFFGNAYSSIANYSSTPKFSYSLIEGSGGSGLWDSALGVDMGNNIDVDPLFVDISSGDFHLLPGSPAINSGDTTGFDIPPYDLEGNARIMGDTIDMGCYEYDTSISISEFKDIEGRVIVYPNPTVGLLIIKSDRIPETVEVYNISGELIISKKPDKESYLLMLDYLTSGVYTLRVIFEDLVFSKKVIKM